jgi:hypothetical protein
LPDQEIKEMKKKIWKCSALVQDYSRGIKEFNEYRENWMKKSEKIAEQECLLVSEILINNNLKSEAFYYMERYFAF